MNSSPKNLIGHFRTTLLAGFLLAIPVVLTFVILKFVFDVFDPILKPIFELAFDRYTPGMGIAALVVFMYLLGLATTHFLGRRMVAFGEHALHRIPIVNAIYRAAQEATKVFSTGLPKSEYSTVVFVDFPGSGLKSMGLVTSKTKDKDGKTLLAVYMPTSPFPTSGFLVFLPPERVTFTDIRIDDAMKLIVSAGIVSPHEIVSYPTPVVMDPPSGAEDQAPDKANSNQ